jgi:hypothetical protein
MSSQNKTTTSTAHQARVLHGDAFPAPHCGRPGGRERQGKSIVTRVGPGIPARHGDHTCRFAPTPTRARYREGHAGTLAHAHLVLACHPAQWERVRDRSAPRRTFGGCVLLAASWSRQLFDIDQFRSIRYRLVDGLVPERRRRPFALLKVAIPPKMESRTPGTI